MEARSRRWEPISPRVGRPLVKTGIFLFCHVCVCVCMCVPDIHLLPPRANHFHRGGRDRASAARESPAMAGWGGNAASKQWW